MLDSGYLSIRDETMFGLFNKKPKPLSHMEMRSSGKSYIKMLMQQSGSNLALLQNEAIYDRWFADFDKQIEEMSQLDSIESQGLVLREFVLDHLDKMCLYQEALSRSDDAHRKNAINSVIADQEDLLDLSKEEWAEIHISHHNAVAISMLGVAKDIEGLEPAVRWFEAYATGIRIWAKVVVDAIVEKTGAESPTGLGGILAEFAEQRIRTELREQILSVRS